MGIVLEQLSGPRPPRPPRPPRRPGPRPRPRPRGGSFIYGGGYPGYGYDDRYVDVEVVTVPEQPWRVQVDRGMPRFFYASSLQAALEKVPMGLKVVNAQYWRNGMWLGAPR